MHEEWTDRLSEYLDDELPPADRRAVDEHLEACAECRAVLGDLRRVVARARNIEPRPPAAELWRGVSERIEGGRHAARRVSFTMPQALAAGLAIALLSGAVVWQVLGRPESLHDRASQARNDTTPVVQPVRPAPAPEPAPDIATVGYADAQYDAAVADLEKAVKEGRGRLDANTIAIVEHNLQIIDQAIDQARRALESDPSNSYLSSHLVEARRRKLDLLRRAAALTEGN